MFLNWTTISAISVESPVLLFFYLKCIVIVQLFFNFIICVSLQEVYRPTFCEAATQTGPVETSTVGSQCDLLDCTPLECQASSANQSKNGPEYEGYKKFFQTPHLMKSYITTW